MKDIYEIIKQIQATSGRNDKESIIKANKDNVEFKQLLKFVYDPFIVLGIGSKKLNKFMKKATGDNNQFHDLFHVLNYLRIHNTGTDTTLKMVSEFLAAEQDDEMREFYSQVITKSLKIGATAKSINKALGVNLIREFNVLLAKKFEDEQHKVEGKEFTITEKLDGMRVIMVKDNDDVKFFSRQGQPLGLNEIIEDAVKLPNNAYDGELLIHNADDYKDRDVLQETLKIARKDGDKNGLILHLFDMLPVEQFEKGKSSKVYKERKRELISTLDGLDFNFITYVPNLYQGKDMSVIPKLLEEMNSQGKEGLMLNLNGYWEGKRSDQLLKIKTMQTFDELCVGIIEGEGKYKGELGAIVVKYKGQYPLQIGSGFTDEQREYYFNNRDEIVGKVVEIQYFRESQNVNGGLSVSFPIFKSVREDGKEVSYY